MISTGKEDNLYPKHTSTHACPPTNTYRQKTKAPTHTLTHPHKHTLKHMHINTPIHPHQHIHTNTQTSTHRLKIILEDPFFDIFHRPNQKLNLIFPLTKETRFMKKSLTARAFHVIGRSKRYKSGELSN